MSSFPVPSPPNDVETKTIIDKLANFVARNGPEFEKMTMNKKSDDPKFAFLFGGENNPYYRWKVEMERVQTGVISTVANPTVQSSPSVSTSRLATEHNDAALIESLNAVKVKEQTDISTQGLQDPLEVEFNNVVKPVMDTCSKEAIASGKSWIFSHTHTADECGRMSHYTMRRSLNYPGVEFGHKLHLVYLINDLLHHCIRKGADDLKQAMETVIVQIFYNIFSSSPHSANELIKVLDIWDSQDYLSKTKLEQIRRVLQYPEMKLPVDQCIQVVTEQSTVPSSQPPAPWQSQQQQQFTNQFPQHHSAANPWQQQYPSSWEPPPPPPVPVPPAPTGTANMYDAPPPPPWVHQPNHPAPWVQPPLQQQTAEPTPLFAPSEAIVPPKDTPTNENEALPPVNDDVNEEDEESLLANKETIDYNHQPVGQEFQQSIQVFDYQHRPAPSWDIHGPMHPPMPPPPPHMGGAPPPFYHDRPPFFPPPSPYHHDALPPPPAPPPIPYFDLPAGLMVPLVPLHESSYTPLKPHHVCLPAPQPPSERLIEAVEEFYYPPSAEKPRNDDGWEAKALLDFFNAKAKAKDSMRERSRDVSRRSRRRRSRSRSYSPKRRRRRSTSSRSRSRSYSPKYRRRSSRSPSSDDSSSSSYSPPRRRRRSTRSGSLSPSTPTVEDLDNRSKKPTGRASNPQSSESLTEDNVGHQLLKRMGWEGAGLGARGQGIQEPIKGGEARDKLNQFAGVGINMQDPFEQFRRNKSYTFNRRPPPPESS